MLEVTLYPIHNAFTFVKFNVKLMADEEIDGKKKSERERKRWINGGRAKKITNYLVPVKDFKFYMIFGVGKFFFLH